MKDEKIPNPQGKGLSPAVGYLVETTSGMDLPSVYDDNRETIVDDYLSSLLVLSCEFKFRPVRGKKYHIYSHNNTLLLSLISEEEGGTEIFDGYVGSCVLKDDLTWTVQLCGDGDFRIHLAGGEENDETIDGRFKKLLEQIMDGEIGKYEVRLGYYQNVLNFALGKSINLRSQRLLELESDVKAGAQLLSSSTNEIR